MQINPTNEVHLYKSVPFYIDYKNIRLFESTTEQSSYFASLPNTLNIENVTYTRANGSIKVPFNRDTILEYNYMSFKNKDYGNKVFYAFITDITYVNPTTARIYFTIDEWQTWCFNLNFRESFIERKHCKRWNSDGTPVINTEAENLDIGSEYVVKAHAQYNNDLYWVCFVTSVENTEITIMDVPTILTLYYAPVYKTTNSVIQGYVLNNLVTGGTPANTALNIFRNDEVLNGKLASCFIVSEPPFSYTYSITDGYIQINSNDCMLYSLKGEGKAPLLLANKRVSNPATTVRTFPKYGDLRGYVTESKLLMYPYSFIELIDGGGNNFIIKPEYVDDDDINIRTFTSGGLNSKQAHIVEHYRYSGVVLNYCRWELGNGIINNYHNNLTVIDDYSSAYLQGNANSIAQSVQNTLNQVNANNKIAENNFRTSVNVSAFQTLSNVARGIIGGGLESGNPTIQGVVQGGIDGLLSSFSQMARTSLEGQNSVKNTELQGNVTYQNAVNSMLAKKQDIANVADNVALQGGDVYFTFQNQYNGYCLVYKQISNEYISILEGYFKKYGYSYNKLEVPNLHTRESYDYIKTIDVNILASINNESLLKIKTIFDNGVTIWHTNDIGNYALANNEI